MDEGKKCVQMSVGVLSFWIYVLSGMIISQASADEIVIYLTVPSNKKAS